MQMLPKNQQQNQLRNQPHPQNEHQLREQTINSSAINSFARRLAPPQKKNEKYTNISPIPN